MCGGCYVAQMYAFSKNVSHVLVVNSEAVLRSLN